MAVLRPLLLALALSAAPAAAEDRPRSVAALAWGLAEIAVDLDLPLTGVADAKGYATWVGAPALPAGIRDLGLRAEPNLEALSALAPGLILAGDQQAGLAARLEEVAPTMTFDQFAEGRDSAAAARRIYIRIARDFGKEDRATRRLGEIDAALAAAGERVRAAWGGPVPPVLPVRLLTASTVRIHGANSMAAAALDAMGLVRAGGNARSEWGFTLAPIERLAEYPDAAIVHFDPFADGEDLYASPLWRAIPAVAAGRFAATGPAWTFGSVVSLEILGDRLADALVAMAGAA